MSGPEQDLLESLTLDELYMASSDFMAGTLMGKPVLAEAANDRQEAALDGIMKHGLVYLDTERGHIGYRATWKGMCLYSKAVQLWNKLAASSAKTDSLATSGPAPSDTKH